MEDKGAHLHVTNSPLSRAVTAVARYVAFDASVETATAGPVLLVSGKKLEGVEAANYIASQKKDTQNLLGNDAAAQKEVQGWLEWAEKELGDTSGGLDKKKHYAKLGKLHQALTDRVFLVDNRLSLADIVLASVTAPLIAGLDERSQLGLFALVRWFDFLQHFPVIGQNIAPTTVEFDLNAPFKPQPTKPAKPEGPEKAGETKAKPAPGKGKGQQAKKETTEGEKEKEATPTPTEKPEGQAQKGKGQQQAKGQQPKAQAKPKPAAKKDDKADITRLDIRVGVIRSVSKHPSAERLYVEQIDLGETETRQVVSGLVEFVPESEMLGARVICLCNLKPAKMRDVMSHAMVLCGSNKEHTAVELIKPPDDAKIGEHIVFAGYEGEPDERLNPKRNPWSLVQPDLFISDDLVASYKDKSGKVVPFMTSAGPCKVKSLAGGSIA